MYRKFQTIITHCVDVDVTNNQNHTAIMSACQKGGVDVITVLLGSEPSTSDDNGDKYLHIIISKNLSKYVIQALIDHGVNVDAMNK